jgi:hypothetical protein
MFGGIYRTSRLAFEELLLWSNDTLALAAQTTGPRSSPKASQWQMVKVSLFKAFMLLPVY